MCNKPLYPDKQSCNIQNVWAYWQDDQQLLDKVRFDPGNVPFFQLRVMLLKLLKFKYTWLIPLRMVDNNLGDALPSNQLLLTTNHLIAWSFSGSSNCFFLPRHPLVHWLTVSCVGHCSNSMPQYVPESIPNF